MQSYEYGGTYQTILGFHRNLLTYSLLQFITLPGCLSMVQMWGLSHSQDNLVIVNLVIECLQQRTVLLIAFCVASNPSYIWNQATYIYYRNLSFLKVLVITLSRGYSVSQKSRSAGKAFSTLFCCYFSLKREKGRV